MWTLTATSILPWWTSASFGLIVLVIFVNSLRSPPIQDAGAQDQADLDHYLSRPLSNIEVGLAYERYIGFLYEMDGCDVQYHGATKGYEDLGRDLIVRAGAEVWIVQTKCWAKHKQIPEKYVYQLHGTVAHFNRENKRTTAKAVLYTTASFSPAAVTAARVLGVELKVERLDRSYPMIKCCVSEMDGTGTYHLPFDKAYDAVKIEARKGDRFAKTVAEARAAGFGRARPIPRAA